MEKGDRFNELSEAVQPFLYGSSSEGPKKIFPGPPSPDPFSLLQIAPQQERNPSETSPSPSIRSLTSEDWGDLRQILEEDKQAPEPAAAEAGPSQATPRIGDEGFRARRDLNKEKLLFNQIKKLKRKKDIFITHYDTDYKNDVLENLMLEIHKKQA